MKKTTQAIIAASVMMFPSALFAAQDYAKALNLSTKFFGAQRCGTTQSWMQDSCHWHDKSINGVDLSGGWHDCGDHIKFGQTNGFAAAMMLHSYMHFPSAHKDNYSQAFSAGSKDNIPDVLNEVKVFTDYLLKTLVGTKLYFQVGSSDVDHNSCSEPKWRTENEPTRGGTRKAFSVTDGGASNIAGMNAAVLALMSEAYRQYDGTYADKCLDMAKKMYDFGDKKHTSQPSVGDNGSKDNTYEAGEWIDDMAFGAIQLYAATKDAKYQTAAKGFMDDILLKRNFVDATKDLLPSYFAIDYTNVAPLAAYSFERYTTEPSYAAKLKIETEAYIKTMNSMGMAFFEGWGSLKYSNAAAYIALLSYDLDNTYTAAKDFAKKNIDFVLGDHGSIPNDAPAGYSFLVDYGTSYPNGQIHHSGAAGIQVAGDFDLWHSNSYQNKKKLIGAVVGGPTEATGGYHNDRDEASWGGVSAAVKSNEVCIYYNAPFVAAVSALVQLENGNPTNYYPTDVVLSSLTMSEKQPAGTLAAIITAVDRNSGDTHTFTIEGTSNEFEISGNQLKTKLSLNIGDYKLKIKATDNKGGSFTEDVTISVQQGDSKDNIIYDLGWYGYTDSDGSKINGKAGALDSAGNAALLKDGVVKATFVMIKSDEAKMIYPDGTLAIDSIRVANKVKSFSASAFIKIEYKSDNDFILALPMGVDSNFEWASWQAALPNTNNVLKTETFELNSTRFAKPDWATKIAPWDKTKMYNFAIKPSFEGATGSVEVQTVVIDGVQPTPIFNSVVRSSGFGVTTTTNASNVNLSFAAKQGGTATVSLYSMNGREMVRAQNAVSTGANSMNISTRDLAAGMYVMRLSVNGLVSTSRISIMK